ncbi:ubiquinone biosynthesis accessory factor UbiK [Rickettsiella endosymbiont of Miltochrista miniata]|uniref:ubiquinone biosynthesis accessory factor UbiK n=1 Tax=Rickettsiella endosymbiont of Miltochrista miniata TaxID=3066239 RepID=UPI00313CBDCC
MFDTKFIDDTVKRLGESLPPGLNKFKKDLEKNFRAILQSMFAKFDLVTREEFDVQKKVLAKTRIKITALEKQIASLENHLTKTKHKRIVK